MKNPCLWYLKIFKFYIKKEVQKLEIQNVCVSFLYCFFPFIKLQFTLKL
jgi:hypothetical protein